MFQPESFGPGAMSGGGHGKVKKRMKSSIQLQHTLSCHTLDNVQKGCNTDMKMTAPALERCTS